MKNMNSAFMLFAVFLAMVGGAAGITPQSSDDACGGNGAAEASAPQGLVCDARVDPLGVDEVSPRLSWKLVDARRGARQTAYRILVAGSPEALASNRGDLWDSGKVVSGQSCWVSYAGKPLAPRQPCYWKVCVWDQDEREGEWSSVASWEMAPPSSASWKARWITAPGAAPSEDPASRAWIRMAVIPTPARPGEDSALIDQEKREALAALEPAPLFRKEFVVPAKVRRARVYVCGLGFYELSLNGSRVGDRLSAPVESYYPDHAFFNTYDITDQLKEGTNCIGMLVGDGLYHAPITQYELLAGAKVYGAVPGMILQLEVETEDNRKMVVASDASWTSDVSPLVKDALWVGEAWDATKEQDGWNRPGFDDSTWRSAIVAEPLSKRLSPQLMEPERVIRRVKPVRMTHPAEGVWVFDMGELVSGVAELNVDVPAGTCMALRYGEGVRGLWPGSKYDRVINNLYYPDPSVSNELDGMLGSKKRGTAVVGNVGNKIRKVAVNTDVYRACGSGKEVWHRLFGTSAFRFVELTGYPGTPDLDTVSGVVIHTDLPRTSRFESANPLLAREQKACVDTLLYCLHHGAIYDNHSERQNNPCCIELRSCNPYAADVYNLWRKEVRDMIDWTAAAGGIPPWYLRLRAFQYKGAQVPWGQAYVAVPWLAYLYYGDKDLLEEAYPLVKRYLGFWLEDRRYLSSNEHGGDTAANASTCDINNGKRDWADTTSHGLVSGGLMVDMLRTAERMARRLGKDADAAVFNAEAGKIAGNLNREYYNSADKIYQCPKTFPPNFTWLSEENRVDEGKIRPTQGGGALALTAGFAPGPDREAIAAGIVRDMKENWNGHYSTGDMLSWRLPEALGRNGQIDAAYGILARREYPGLGHCLSVGLNTICENLNTYNGPPAGDSFCQVNRLGLSNWLYEGLCGIQPDPERPGFKHIILHPQIPVELDSASLDFESNYGRISSGWKKQNGTLFYCVTVPPNTTATVHVPASSAECVTESGMRAGDAPGVRFVREEKGAVLYEVQAGCYRFLAEY